MARLKEHYKNWPESEEPNLSGKSKKKFNKRRFAVTMYCDGFTLKEIESKTGFPPSEIQRFYKRCISPDKYGNPTGFSALVPNSRLYRQKSKGKFQELLREHPSLEELIRERFLGIRRKNKPKIRKCSISLIHNEFIAECHKVGISEHDYPLSTKTKARESLRKYCQYLKQSHLTKYVRERVSRDNARSLENELSQNLLKKNITSPYGCVQLDGHNIDSTMLIPIRRRDGIAEWVPATNIWLLAVICEASRAILSYSVVINSNYRMIDVLYCLYKSMTPWHKKEPGIPEISYSENAGLPSGLIKTCKYRAFDTIQLDNHKSHTSLKVINNIISATGANVVFGPKGVPEIRGVIERFFKTIENEVFQYLPSSTGSNPDDIRRFQSEENAIKYSITVDDIEDLMDVEIANYNAKYHSTIGCPPLRYILHKDEAPGKIIRRVPEQSIKGTSLLEVEYIRVVRGKCSGSIRKPKVNIECAKYTPTNNDLMINYYNKKINLRVNFLDFSIAKAFDLDTGKFLCYFMAENRWSERHSYYERKLFNSLFNQGKLNSDESSSNLVCLNKHLQKRAGRNKSRIKKSAQFEKDRKVKLRNQKSGERENITPLENLKSPAWYSDAYSDFKIIEDE